MQSCIREVANLHLSLVDDGLNLQFLSSVVNFLSSMVSVNYLVTAPPSCISIRVTENLMPYLLQEKAVPKSKYEEDVFINNHSTVWGSWWKDHQWGYKCCKQFTRNSYCTGQAGIEAAEASAELMRTNIERKEALQEKPAEKVEKNLASWGSEVPDDVVLDKKKLKEALKKVMSFFKVCVKSVLCFKIRL